MPVNINEITNFFPTAYENTVPMSLTSSVLAGATSVAVTGGTNYTNGEIVTWTVDAATPSLKQVFTGTWNSGSSTVTGVIWTEVPTGGVNVAHSAGATVIDYVSATHWDQLITGILTVIAQAGGLNSSLTITTPTIVSPTISNATSSGKVSGWTSAAETWSFASSSTITVPTDATTKYDVGDYIQMTQTTVKYFIITGVTSTVLTVAGMTPGSLETVANAAITLNSYSKARNPHGLPAGVSGVWQTWAPGFGGALTPGNATVVARYTQNGKTINGLISVILGSTSSVGSGAITFAAPVAMNATWNPATLLPQIGIARNNGNGANFADLPIRADSTTLFDIVIPTSNGTYVGEATFSSTVPSTWTTGTSIGGTFTYEAA